LWFVKSLPWPLDIHGSELSFYRNIFLSQYRVQKCLVCNNPTVHVVMRIEDEKIVEKEGESFRNQ